MAECEWLDFASGDAAQLERRLPPVHLSPGRWSEGSPALAQNEEEQGLSTAPPPQPPSGRDALQAAARPFVTLTFATSLDSSLALAPGVRTAISGPKSKAMTHFLRSRHDAILVGAGTAIADDPGLNCRLAASSPGGGDSGGARKPQHQPRPIVVDPHGRWRFSEGSKVMRFADSGLGLAPFIIITPAALQQVSAERRAVLESRGGRYIVLAGAKGSGSGATSGILDWSSILSALHAEGIRSLMIEGGGHVINTLLGSRRNSAMVNSVIITIAPTWLGPGGVVVSPEREPALDHDGIPAPASAPLRLANVSWHQLGDDMVLCGDMGQ
ncbi:riboflavin biosynthesis protein Rib7 [Magnaporthiopsis poae ATCC 64411]|uniref:2,5-diamino-6-ribosylamino-4(3H)-pyrimidinone 5'-phosphate reductase n=1 Tax=Magnaporthiopsis poae (strain ATCC 64411 / 73-15) TaxID=644358 RepID=A0A0C4DMJ4_MAGP6|nr:riboflavin biosynthesis protein Rib7 [Magnaporthiopsis poae ATCC 64411]